MESSDENYRRYLAPDVSIEEILTQRDIDIRSLMTLDEEMGRSGVHAAGPEDYERWLASPFATLEDTVLLDAGIAPISRYDNSLAVKVPKLLRYRYARHAIENHDLKAESRDGHRSWTLSPFAYIQWRVLDPIMRSEPMWYFNDFTEDIGNSARACLRRTLEAYALSLAREQILGAATACLAIWPEKCRFQNGGVNASAIATLICENANKFWPRGEAPPSGKDAVRKRILFWIKKAR